MSVRGECLLDVRSVAIALSSALVCVACSMPIHYTQSPHAMAYSQRYTLCSDQKNLREHLIKDIFGAPPSYSPNSKNIDQLLVRGQINYLVRAAPGGDASAFLIEGGGWHLMFYGETDDEDAHRYVGSADFRLKDDGPLSLADLRRGSLVMRVSVISKASFTRPLHAFQSNAEVFLRIFVKEISPNIYTIDYTREHDIGWPVMTNGPRRFVQIIGHMQFIGPNDGRNLFDAREIRFIADDYAALEIGKLDAPHRPANVSFVEWLPEQPCKDRYMDILL